MAAKSRRVWLSLPKCYRQKIQEIPCIKKEVLEVLSSCNGDKYPKQLLLASWSILGCNRSEIIELFWEFFLIGKSPRSSDTTLLVLVPYNLRVLRMCMASGWLVWWCTNSWYFSYGKQSGGQCLEKWWIWYALQAWDWESL